MFRRLCFTGLVATLARARVMNRMAVTDLGISLSITTDKLLSSSPLLKNVVAPSRVPTNVTITNTTSITTTSSLIVAADSTPGLYDWVARKITTSSDANSCAPVYGTDFDGKFWEGYAYQTITEGLNCDTVAPYATIRAAVGCCADELHEAQAVRVVVDSALANLGSVSLD